MAVAQLLLNPTEVSGANAPQSYSAKPAGQTPPSASKSLSSNYISQGSILDWYKLGPGDQLEVHLIVDDNALALDYQFVINPEGKIFFPNIGEIYLINLSIKQAKAELTNEIKKKYKERFDLSLMISLPKMIKIYVTGQVSEPGLKVIYDGTKISDVMKIAGVAAGGSNRKVFVKRNGKILKVDLYKILLKGNIDADINVQMGDVIEVPPIGSARVTVMGEVPRPGQYELQDDERLKDALAMAGYVGANSALSEVAYLRRKQGEDDFDNYKLNLYSMFEGKDESLNYVLEDGDIILVPAIKAYVYVYGDVNQGGRFDYQPGQRLSDYINMAAGPLAKANLSGVTVTRQENGEPQVYHIDVSKILKRGIADKDIEIMAGDVINVPGNFFYFSDFGSFANTILLALTLYTTVVGR
ncbi:MAG: SLBB domain-containing protein [Candidatus Margulisiibacteriota bacterium]